MRPFDLTLWRISPLTYKYAMALPSFLWIWSRLLKKSFMENFIFCAVWWSNLIIENLQKEMKYETKLKYKIVNVIVEAN